MSVWCCPRYQGKAIAAVTVDSKWTPNKALECLKCYGTSSLEHPAVQMVAMERGKYYLGEHKQRRCYRRWPVVHTLVVAHGVQWNSVSSSPKWD